MELQKKVKRWKDSVGKDVQLRAFESFSLFLDAENELTVRGCETLTDYTDTHIGMDCAGRCVDVWGAGLLLSLYDDEQLRVCGQIEKIVFSPRAT